MAKYVVIGGGIAGLSSAVFLSQNGHTVDLYEASPKLGGRTYSFNHKNQKVETDNGQHILMGCYYNTFSFLEIINSINLLDFQKHLKVNFIKEGKSYVLSAEKYFYPFNILSGFWNYEVLNNLEKINVLKLFTKLIFKNPISFQNISSREFLSRNKQSEEAINNFWEIIHVGTMNCNLSNSSAELFVRVLKQIFLSGNRATKIVLPKTGLTKVFCDGAKKFVEERNGTINLSEKILRMETDDDGSIIKIFSNKSEINAFDYIVLAMPPHQIEHLLKNSNIDYRLPEYEHSPILNIHLWLSENKFSERFYGLINSGIHWVFNNGNYLTLTTSSAVDMIDKNEKEIFEYSLSELEKNFNFFDKETVTDYQVIKEKRATFLPTAVNSIERKNLSDGFNNILFAGDWTNTQLPATIEGAAKSGKRIADKLS